MDKGEDVRRGVTRIGYVIANDCLENDGGD